MIMKKYISLFITLISVAVIVACGRKALTDNFIVTERIPEFTVDELMKSPQAFVDSIVTVEGRCIHICRMTGNAMYIVFDNDSVMLRCIAAAPVGGAFDDSIMGRRLKFSGMFREERLTKEGIGDLREQYAGHLQMISSNENPDTALFMCHRRCEFERRYRNQDNIVGFEEEMNDYSRRIDHMAKYDGKNYLSFYYLETIKIED